MDYPTDVIKIADAVTLTGTAVASDSYNIQDAKQLQIDFKYTAGTGGTGLSFTIEVSPDPSSTADGSSTWIQTGNWSSGSSAAETKDTFLASATKNASILLVRLGKKIRVKYSETGGPSPFGSVTVWLVQRSN